MTDRSLVLIVVVLVGTAMVGLGEELYLRGILRVSVRAHHGELLTLVVTSVVFGLAHSLGSFLSGLPIGFIAFQVAVTALDGAIYYGILRATGRLWVPIVLHGLNDAALYLVSADSSSHVAAGFNPATWTSIAPVALGILTAVLVISSIRQDRHTRARRQHQTVTRHQR